MMNTGKISKIDVDKRSKSMILTLENSKQKQNSLLITVPRELFTLDIPKTVTVNNKEVHYNQTTDDVETGLEIHLSADATNVRISTTNNTNLGHKNHVCSTTLYCGTP